MEDSVYLNSDEEDYDIPPFLHLEFRDGIHVLPVRRSDHLGRRMGLLRTLRAPFKCYPIDLEEDLDRKSRLESFIQKRKSELPQHQPENADVEIVWLRNSVQESVGKNPHSGLLPLIPDFTGFVKNASTDIPALNLTQADSERTMRDFKRKEFNLSPSEPIGDSDYTSDSSSRLKESIDIPTMLHCAPTCSTSNPVEFDNRQGHEIMDLTLPDMQSYQSPLLTPKKLLTEKTLPDDIVSRMWPEGQQEVISPTPEQSTPIPQTSNEVNLKKLRKRPLNTLRLAEIREKVTTGLHKLKLETEPKPKKFKREDIVWDLDDDEGSSTSSGHMTDEQRSQMNKRFKKLKVTSKVTDLSGGPSPRRRSVVFDFDSEGNVRKTWSGGPPIDTSQVESTPPSAAFSPKMEGRKILKASKGRFIRKCRICGEENKNLKAHLATEHLGAVWWGVIGDQTCWRCHDYHWPGDIIRCNGGYVPLLHRDVLLARHREFVSFLQEDFGVSGPSDLIDRVRNLGLHKLSVSDFSSKEIYFLKELDRIYSLPQKAKYSALYPTRISELFHWKTITEIMVYLSEAGNISGSRRGGQIVALVDTRCDAEALYQTESHTGLMKDLPLIQRELRLFTMKSIITEINDPTIDIEQVKESLKDPALRIAFGVTPNMAGQVSQEYYDFCFNEVRNPRIAGIGGLGLDSSLGTVPMDTQKQVMCDFIDLAKSCSKPVRIFSTGDLENGLELLRGKIEPDHPVHLLNFDRDLTTAQLFTDYHINGYIGISTQICDPSPALLETIREIPIENMVLESNCPSQVISYQVKSKPTDVVKILNTISCIKKIDANEVAKIVRRNVNKLYHF